MTKQKEPLKVGEKVLIETCAGNKVAFVTSVHAHNSYMCTLKNNEGLTYSEAFTRRQVIKRFVKKKSTKVREIFVNIYEDGTVGAHKTRETAKERAVFHKETAVRFVRSKKQ